MTPDSGAEYGAIAANIDQWFDDELGMIKRLVEEQAVAAWDGSASV